jgi:hypothetical protein
MTLLVPYLGQQPVTDFSLNFASLKYGVSLLASTAVPLPIPGDSNHYKAVIRVFPGARVFVAKVPLSPSGQVAAFPVSNSFTPIISEIVPPEGLCREVKSGDILSFISDVASTIVSVVLYSSEPNS